MSEAFETTLVLLCKRPALGYGKQRLAAQLGKPEAYQIAELLLHCALEDLRAWPGGQVLCPADRADIEWARALLPDALLVPDVDIIDKEAADNNAVDKLKTDVLATQTTAPSLILPQSGGNLGERLNYLDARLRHFGLSKLAFIGSDCPLLQPEHLTAVAKALNHQDVVLMPAEDGGVVVMSASSPWPDIAPLDWSTDRLDGQLGEACLAAGLRVARLQSLYDLDNAWQLGKLVEDLAEDQRPARVALRELCRSLG